MLHELSKWLADNSLAVEAFAAAAASVLLTAVLVVTTIIYARTTGKILEESRKATEAAAKQAEAAERHLAILQSQIEEGAGRALATMKENLTELSQTANHWFDRMSVWGQLTPQSGVDLLPGEWSLSLEHARRISPDLLKELLTLQRSGRQVSLLIDQFTAKAATYRSQTEANQIKELLVQIMNGCDTASKKFANLADSSI